MSNKKYFNNSEKPKENLKQNHKKKSRSKLKHQNKSPEASTSERILKQIDDTRLMPSLEPEFTLERTSTPIPSCESICEHCKHFHMQECCMYVYDKYEDIMRYSNFKLGAEESYNVINYNENLGMKISATTPTFFPGYTERIPEIADMRIQYNHPQMYQAPPIVYLRQYFWPILLPPNFHPPSPQVFNFNLHDINNMKFYQQQMITGNFYPTYTESPPYLAKPSPSIPISIPAQRQMPIPFQHANGSPYINHENHQQQTIESQNYMPMNYNLNESYVDNFFFGQH